MTCKSREVYVKYNTFLNWCKVIILVNIIKIELVRQKSLRPNWTAAEGFVLGVGAKMFTIAGPVIVYGTVASVIYGVIYWITTLF